MSAFPKLIYRHHALPIKISANYFVDIDKFILKIILKGKRLRIANTTLKEKNKVRKLTLYNFKNYYMTILIKTMWH